MTGYTLHLTEEEMNVLRDIMWYDSSIKNADRCGIRPLLIGIFGSRYKTGPDENSKYAKRF